MDTPYVLSFDEIREFADAQDTVPEGGSCKQCRYRRACRADKKAREIGSLLRMEAEHSRFPGLLKLMRSHPDLPNCIPAFFYAKAYGSYSGYLPCPFRREEFVSHLDQLEAVYELLTDERSKSTLLNVLMYRLTLDREYAQRAYSSEPQYFISPFRSLGADEVYVDCGAYTGDTFETYCRYNRPPQAAYLFEPDSAMARRIEQVSRRFDDQTSIHLIEKGVYRETGQRYFAVANASESHLSEEKTEGSVPIQVITLDEAVPEDVTFLKMDIEGSEKDALLGAGQHIRSKYPKLAVCVYHRPQDLWEIPLMIRDSFPEYGHYALRHHSGFFAETVLYVYR